MYNPQKHIPHKIFKPIFFVLFVLSLVWFVRLKTIVASFFLDLSGYRQLMTIVPYFHSFFFSFLNSFHHFLSHFFTKFHFIFNQKHISNSISPSVCYSSSFSSSILWRFENEFKSKCNNQSVLRNNSYHILYLNSILMNLNVITLMKKKTNPRKYNPFSFEISILHFFLSCWKKTRINSCFLKKKTTYTE